MPDPWRFEQRFNVAGSYFLGLNICWNNSAEKTNRGRHDSKTDYEFVSRFLAFSKSNLVNFWPLSEKNRNSFDHSHHSTFTEMLIYTRNVQALSCGMFFRILEFPPWGCARTSYGMIHGSYPTPLDFQISDIPDTRRKSHKMTLQDCSLPGTHHSYKKNTCAFHGQTGKSSFHSQVCRTSRRMPKFSHAILWRKDMAIN